MIAKHFSCKFKLNFCLSFFVFVFASRLLTKHHISFERNSHNNNMTFLRHGAWFSYVAESRWRIVGSHRSRKRLNKTKKTKGFLLICKHRQWSSPTVGDKWKAWCDFAVFSNMAVGMKNADKTRSESRPSTATGASSEKSEERKPHKQQPDNKERVRNKVG